MNTRDKLKVMQEITETNRQRVEAWKRGDHVDEGDIRGVLIDIDNSAFSITTLKKSIDAYHEALNCRAIDIVQHKIGGRVFDIICDVDGLSAENPAPSAVSFDGEVVLCGNLFVVKHDGAGGEDSLSLDDADYILRYIRKLWTKQKPNGYWVLYGVGYC